MPTIQELVGLSIPEPKTKPPTMRERKHRVLNRARRDLRILRTYRGRLGRESATPTPITAKGSGGSKGSGQRAITPHLLREYRFELQSKLGRSLPSTDLVSAIDSEIRSVESKIAVWTLKAAKQPRRRPVRVSGFREISEAKKRVRRCRKKQ